MAKTLGGLCALTMLLFIFGAAIVTTIANSDADENVKYKIIETVNGPVRGQNAETLFDGKKYYSYRGIPYAKAPTGDLRFKAPQPSGPWAEVRDAFEYGNACIQPKRKDDENVKGDEDCLFLNIFVPDVNTEQKLPVMLFIHGGGYSEGSGDDGLHGPDFLINEGVILVTVNYRLGVFGFLSLGTPEYSGNMGLKDQQLALRWVNENIERFGGDKNSITLFGHSAGSSSTHFHVLSPSSRGLFNRAILMSGSALNVWAHTSLTAVDYLWNMFVFADKIKRHATTYDELVEVLKTVTANDLAKHLTVDMYDPTGPGRRVDIMWAPIVESKADLNPFLVQSPEDIYKDFESNVDTMFGFTSAEMLFLIHREVHNPDLLKAFNEKFEIELPIRNSKLRIDSEEYKSLAEDIRHFYFGEGVDIDNETIVEYNDLLSDIWMTYDIGRSAILHAAQSSGKTYYYRFSVDSKFNQFKIMFNVSLPGSSHADELCYLFRCHINPTLYNDVDKDSLEYKMLRYMTKLWTNFAKYGEPSPNNDPVEFRPIEKDAVNFLDIHNEGLIPALSPHQKYMRFWDDFHRKHEELSTQTTLKSDKRSEL